MRTRAPTTLIRPDAIGSPPRALNRCEQCGRQISRGEIGYFALDAESDRFQLECTNCRLEHGVYVFQD